MQPVLIEKGRRSKIDQSKKKKKDKEIMNISSISGWGNDVIKYDD